MSNGCGSNVKPLPLQLFLLGGLGFAQMSFVQM